MRPARQGLPLPLGQVETCHLAAPAASAENAPSFTTSNQRDATPLPGPVLFAYDGSELAAFAIAHAATQLAPRRDALVLCVWQPANVGFTPAGTKRFNADQATEVRQAAEGTAAHGASLAGKAGFLARSMAVEAAPTWQGIVQTAVQHNASLIAMQGSIAAAQLRGVNRPETV